MEETMMGPTVEDVKVWGLSDVQIEELKAQVSHIIKVLDAAGVDVHEILRSLG
jgi:hypothetical protein